MYHCHEKKHKVLRVYNRFWAGHKSWKAFLEEVDDEMESEEQTGKRGTNSLSNCSIIVVAAVIFVKKGAVKIVNSGTSFVFKSICGFHFEKDQTAHTNIILNLNQ